ncbi:MAG TPA: DUF4126 domain-containing protein [Gemmatimonadaceae bacterium]|nr:DUF4126 domain-containing protein [Gemmatimonadaceae bacterium]
MISLVQSLALAYASGVSLYATILLLGLAERAHWIGPLPGALGVASHPIVLIIAGILATLELGASLIPGIASVWETVHTAIRPPAAAVVAVATAWNADPAIVAAAGILGGGLGLATHATKLGLRVAVDTSPEPFSNGLLSASELSVVAAVSYFVWNHPIITLVLAIVLLVLTVLLVRLVWRTIRRVASDMLRGRWIRGADPGTTSA